MRATSDHIGLYALPSGITYKFTAQMLQRAEHYRHPATCDHCGEVVGEKNLTDMRRKGFWCKACVEAE